MMPFITLGKSNLKYIAIIIILAAIAGGGILGYLYWLAPKYFEKIAEVPEVKVPEKVGEETADWKLYRNEEYGFEVKYPGEFSIESKENMVDIFSPKSLCETDVVGELQKIEVSEKRIKFVLHQGKAYNTIWQSIFGFGAEYYDGIKVVGGKGAKYFSQGTEALFGRTAYLVEKSKTEAVEIDTFIPILIYNCEPLFENSPNELYDLYDKILSTFRFLE